MPHPLGRRGFLSRMAANTLLAGMAPSVALPRLLAESDDAPFAPSRDDPDARVFAAARRRFLFPTNVTYGNTGTLGASPREVMDAFLHGLQTLEHDLPDWPYFQADGEPLTGYQPLKIGRAHV